MSRLIEMKCFVTERFYKLRIRKHRCLSELLNIPEQIKLLNKFDIRGKQAC